MRVKLGDVFQQRKGFITIDDEQEYKRCRIQVRAQGIVLRDLVLGSSIKTKKQQVCRSGDFVVAEIDAKVGGFGFIPEDLDGSVVSSHYFIFELDKSKMLQEYFEILIKSTSFQEKFRARGSTNYAAIRPRDFLNIEIELPNMQRQQFIIKKFKLVVEKQVSIQKNLNHNKKILNSINTSLFSLKTSGIEAKTLGDYLVDISYGLSVSAKPVLNPNDVRLLRITDIQNNSVNWESVPTFFLQSNIRENQLLSEGDIVIARTGGTIGKSFLISEVPYKAVYASYLIRLRVDKNRLNAKFLSFFLQSKLYWEQLNAMKRGTGQPNVNTKVLKSIYLPIPSLNLQEKFVQEFNSLSSKSDKLLTMLNKQSRVLDLMIQLSKKEEL